jgi:hypothetical protein
VSVPVSLDRLRGEIEVFGPSAYALTTGGDGRPHAVLAAVEWRGERLALPAGGRTAANAGERPRVALLWPPTEAGGYSLIVDGDAEIAGGSLLVEPTKAVLHRPGARGAAPHGDGCGSDCIPVV